MGEPTWTREKLRRLVNREIGDYQLIVVSNRQPYVHDLIGGELSYASPAGGLTTAYRSSDAGMWRHVGRLRWRQGRLVGGRR